MTHVTSLRQVTNPMRHQYKIVHKDRPIVVESWDEVQEWWWNNCHLPTFDAVVQVIDKPKTKKKSKGF